MTKISFISASTVRAVPTVRHLLKLFTKEPSIKSVALYDVDSLESHAVVLEPSIVHQAIGQVKNAGAISDKNILRRLRKYFKILLILNRISKSRDRNIVIADSLSICLLTAIALRNRHQLIYYQIEMIDIPSPGWKLNIYRWLFSRYVSLLIVPEKNRGQITAEHLHLAMQKVFVLPNTNFGHNPTPDAPRTNQALKIIHVGNLGEESTHWQEIAESAEKFRKCPLKFEFLGNTNKNFIEAINKLHLNNFQLLKAVSHQESLDFLETADVGLILYNDQSLNTRYCAPNKLYEYWAAGLYVIAADTPGMRGIMTDPKMGVLVDFRDPQMFIKTVYQIMESNSGTCNREHIKREFKNRLHISVFFKQLKTQIPI
jgi:glycosyltransferase involved in cell wall biosynthesis